MTEFVFEPANFAQEAPARLDRIPAYDPERGHYWVVAFLYHINPGKARTQPIDMDMENLVLIGSVQCFHCEDVYAPEMLLTACPGRKT